MLSAPCDPSFQDAFLALARDRSPSDEQKCRALLNLLDAGHALGQGLRRELGVNGLTESGFLVLAHLISTGSDENDPQAELAQSLRLSRPALAEILGRLEISGLVTRKRSPQGQGPLTIRPTALGRQIFSTALSRVLDAFVRAAGTLDDRETALVDLACVRLRQAFVPESSQ